MISNTNMLTSASTPDEVRSQISHWILRAAALTVPALSLFIYLQTGLTGTANNQALRLLLIFLPWSFPLLWLVSAKLSRQTTNSILIALLLSTAFLVQLRGGISVAPVVLQLLTIILSGLLFGARGALSCLGFSLVLMVIAGVSVFQGIVPPIDPSIWNPDNPTVWVRTGIILALLGGVMALSVTYFVSKLENESSHLREAHDALAEARRVEALARLSAGVAHDFNNALTVIIGSVELIKARGLKDEQLLEHISAIDKAATQATDITQSLLAIGRRDVSEVKPVNLQEVFDELVLTRLLPEDISISVQIADNATIIADRSQLHRTLTNLLVNASGSFAGKRGEITVGCRLTLNKSEAEIWVQDNGEGMSESVRSRVFEPYFTTSKSGSGTGLGLTLVKSWIETLGGRVEIESNPGIGTTVRLFLPTTDKNEHTVSSTPDVTPTRLVHSDHANKSVLLVEDDLDVLAATTKILTNTGYEVQGVGSGSEAVKVISDQTQNFDLLLIDGVVPGTPTLEVIEMLRVKRPNAVAVVCSGYVEEELLARGIRTGQIAFIAKPFRQKQLITTIEHELSKVNN